MSIDLRHIINSTERYNFHTHTQFCDGRDSIETIATVGVSLGFKHIGFTPHSPIPVESPCNMSLASVEHYFAELKRVQTLIGNQCRLYRGMEIDYLGNKWGPASEYFQMLDLDYSIGSVHFIPDSNGEYIDIDGSFDAFAKRLKKFFSNCSLRYVVETFYEQSHKMIDAGGFDILGHFDKIAHNASHFEPNIEQQGWYRDLIDDYIRHIIDSGVIVEINTKACAEHQRFFPSYDIWERLVSTGVPLMVNSDAHFAEKLIASRDKALNMLHSIQNG